MTIACGMQLPFSRRAEAEADLIGLKLMALAGYNPEKAPDTFKRLGSVDPSRMQGAAGSDTARMVAQVQYSQQEVLDVCVEISKVDLLSAELEFLAASPCYSPLKEIFPYPRLLDQLHMMPGIKSTCMATKVPLTCTLEELCSSSRIWVLQLCQQN